MHKFISSQFTEQFRQLKLTLENIYYWIKYPHSITPENYLLTNNPFSGKTLNIAYVTHIIAEHNISNAIKPLEKLGTVHVFEMDPEDNRKSWYKKKSSRNEALLKFLKQHHDNKSIDIMIFYVSGYTTSPEILEKINAMGVPMINEGLDDERKFKSRRGKDGVRRGNSDICKFFNLSMTTSRSAIRKYIAEGATPVYIPYAVNPDIYINSSDKSEKYDVIFVGARYGIREEYINYLTKNGINVQAYGYGWDNGSVSTEEMINLFNNAKIVLGFASVGKSENINIIKARDFEVPMTGIFYITQYHRELEQYFELGKEIETYSNKKELLNKISYYLDNPEERHSIAVAGHKKTYDNYNVHKKYNNIMGCFNL